MTTAIYTLGNVIRLGTATPFTDQDDGSLLDPATVTFRVWLHVRSGVVPAYHDFVYGTAPEIVRDSTGMYHMDYEPTDEGLHYYRVFSDAPDAAAEGRFVVNSYQPPW